MLSTLGIDYHILLLYVCVFSPSLINISNLDYIVNPVFDKFWSTGQIVWKAQEIAAKDHAKMYLAHPDEVHAYNDKDWANATPDLSTVLNFENIWHYLNFHPLKDPKVFHCAAIGDIDLN